MAALVVATKVLHRVGIDLKCAALTKAFEVRT